VFQRDREPARRGASARLWVLHESSSGDVDGVAHYRVKEPARSDDLIHRNEVLLGDAWTVDPEVEAALLVYLASLDLTASITTWARPIDDPFRLRLVDDRRYRVLLHSDYQYARILDVPAALTARTYDAPGTVVLGIDDAFRPATSGRYRLDVDGDDGAATCERIGDLHDGDADVFLTIDSLATAYLGDTSMLALADAGRVLASSADGLRRADRLFRTPRAPMCTLEF
jgi:predicted acetyltransferase